MVLASHLSALVKFTANPTGLDAVTVSDPGLTMPAVLDELKIAYCIRSSSSHYIPSMQQMLVNILLSQGWKIISATEDSPFDAGDVVH